jgi:hypothetical protein
MIPPELLSDNLSDVPMIFLITVRVTANVSVWEKLCGRKKKEWQWNKLRGKWQCGGNHVGDRRHNAKFMTFYWKSWGETNSVWSKKVSGIIGLFFGDFFFQMLCSETNLYYFQNQGKYDSSSKGLKWVDVSVVCAVHKKRSKTRYICEFCVMPLHKGEFFQRQHTLKHY